MILEVTKAVIAAIHDATPAQGDWVTLHSLSSADTMVPEDVAVIALLAVAPHPHMTNRPLVEGIAGLVRAPLHLRLSYMITWLGDHEEAQTRLALVAQALHTTPRLGAAELQPPLSNEVAAIGIRMLSPDSDERNQIWGALGRPGRLALFYEVDVAPVPVIERDGVGRVQTHEINYTDELMGAS